MRTSTSAVALSVTVVGLVVGCGGSDAASTGATSAVGGGSSAVTGGAAPDDPIARVAYEFLEAVRKGDMETANSLLTPLAFKQTTERDMIISPPGSPTAKFQIGAVDVIEEDKAIVESIWTDLDPDDQPQDEQIVWALRQTDGGWRISGMAAEVEPGQPAVVIDFENPTAVFQDAEADAQPGQPAQNSAVQTAQDPFQEATAR